MAGSNELTENAGKKGTVLAESVPEDSGTIADAASGTESNETPDPSRQAGISTPHPTLTPPPTQLPPTQTATATSTNIPVPTLTPLPPLSEEEQQQLLTELLTTNGGCKLPCWWGIELNVSSWPETQNILSQLTTLLATNDGGRSYTLRFHILTNNPDATQKNVDILVKDDIVTWIITPLSPLTGENIRSLVSTYGEPADVLILANPSSAAGYEFFNLLLHFPEAGILALFSDMRPEAPPDINGCFGSNLPPNLWLWQPGSVESALTEISVGYGYSAELIATFRPIDQVTDHTIESFTDLVLQMEDELCLATPQDLWQP